MKVAWVVAFLVVGVPLTGAIASIDRILAKVDVFAEVLANVHNYYVETTDTEALIDVAAKAMVASLDRYSMYYTPEEFDAAGRDPNPSPDGPLDVAPTTGPDRRQVGPKVVGIAIGSFQDDTPTLFYRLARTIAPTDALVIDVRGNTGGRFDAAVAMVDHFIEEGPLVTVLGRSGVVLKQEVGHRAETLPHPCVAVLVDGQSASAAEVFAGALQSRGRAHVIGAKTFGKGSVQSVVKLANRGALKLTIARYRLPDGRDVEGRGIEPDELCHGEECWDVARRWSDRCRLATR